LDSVFQEYPIGKNRGYNSTPFHPSYGSFLNIIKGGSIKLEHKTVLSEVSGAFTGEVSASMIKALVLNMSLFGHSERRSYYHEDNDMSEQEKRE
jgi:triosephosphate isomerase